MCDCVPVVFKSEKVREARKEYRCIECQRTIPVGARYSYQAWKTVEDVGRGMSYVRLCLQCAADWERLLKIEEAVRGESCCCYTFFRDELEEMLELGELEMALKLGLIEDHDEMIIRWLDEWPECLMSEEELATIAAREFNDPLTTLPPELPGQLHLFSDS